MIHPLQKKGQKDTSKYLRVNKKRVWIALEWLKENNPNYFDIIISPENLALLPEDGHYQDIQGIKEITFKDQDDGELNKNQMEG